MRMVIVGQRRTPLLFGDETGREFVAQRDSPGIYSMTCPILACLDEGAIPLWAIGGRRDLALEWQRRCRCSRSLRRRRLC